MPTTRISKKAQSSSRSDLDGEMTVLVPRQTKVSILGLGKTLRVGDFPSLDQSAHVYLYWPPGPFLLTQYDKEPGGDGFEANICTQTDDTGTFKCLRY